METGSKLFFLLYPGHLVSCKKPCQDPLSDTKTQQVTPERKGFIESMVEYLGDTRSKEDLKLQLNKVVDWQQPVEGAALSSFNPINLILAAGLLYIAYIMFRKRETSLPEAPGKMVADPDGQDVNEEELQNDLQDKTRREWETSLCKALGEMVADPDREEAVDGEELLNELKEKIWREWETSLHKALGEMLANPDREEAVNGEELLNDLQHKTWREWETSLHKALGEMVADPDRKEAVDGGELLNDLQHKIWRKWEPYLCKALGEMVADPDREEAVDGEKLLNDLQDKIWREWETSLCKALGEMVADPDGGEAVDEEELLNDLQHKIWREWETSLRKALGEMVADPDREEAVDGEELLNDLQDKIWREWETSLHKALGEMVADPDREEAVDGEELLNDLQDKYWRKKEEDLHEALGETIVDTDVGDDNKLQNDLQDKKRFLEVYPQVKLELEQHIRKLHALADKIDKVHKDCTITQVVASSTSAVSGVLTILGLALAPVTAGVSLGLSAAGLGLGAAAAVTSVSTAIVEKVTTVSAEAEASQLVPTSENTGKAIKEILEESTPRLISVSKNSIRNLEVIKKNIDAIKLAKANTRLATNAKQLMTTGRVSAQNARQVQKAFGGTALAMTKGAQIMGAATAGLFLVLDIVSLVEDSKHLHEGAKAESAAELRQQAQNLEQKLQELIQVHDSLTQ